MQNLAFTLNRQIGSGLLESNPGLVYDGGSRITIASSLFGDKPNPGPNHFKTFAGLTVGAGVETLGYEVGNIGFAKVANDRVYGSDRSIKCIYPQQPEEVGFFPLVGLPIINPTGTLYYVCAFNWQKTLNDHVPGILKLFRCGYGDRYGGKPRFYVSLQGTATGELNGEDIGIALTSGTIYAHDVNTVPFPAEFGIIKDQWTIVEFFCRMSTTPTSEDGCFITRSNGVVETNMLNQNTRDVGDEEATLQNFIGCFDGLDRVLDGVDMWIANELSDNTGCSVMMTDTPSGAFTKGMPQPTDPSGIWTDTDIDIIPTRGPFAVGETAYLRVRNDVGDLVYTTNAFQVRADA